MNKPTKSSVVYLGRNRCGKSVVSSLGEQSPKDSQ